MHRSGRFGSVVRVERGDGWSSRAVLGSWRLRFDLIFLSSGSARRVILRVSSRSPHGSFSSGFASSFGLQLSSDLSLGLRSYLFLASGKTSALRFKFDLGSVLG